MPLSAPDGPPAAAGGVFLVLGGARSGKSAFAERLVETSGREAVYVATAEVRDGEMTQRVAAHRSRRGEAWRLVEEPLGLRDVLLEEAREGRAVLVDCLTLWLTNLMIAGREVDAEGERLVETLRTLPAEASVVLVSNEVGLGIVPDNAMARAFRDHAGRLHQSIAAMADRSWFVVAGLPQPLHRGH